MCVIFISKIIHFFCFMEIRKQWWIGGHWSKFWGASNAGWYCHNELVVVVGAGVLSLWRILTFQKSFFRVKFFSVAVLSSLRREKVSSMEFSGLRRSRFNALNRTSIFSLKQENASLVFSKHLLWTNIYFINMTITVKTIMLLYFFSLSNKCDTL